MTNEAAWSIYADVLSLLARLFWWGVLPIVAGAVLTNGTGDVSWLRIGFVVGGLSFPFVVSARAWRVRASLGGQASAMPRRDVLLLVGIPIAAVFIGLGSAVVMMLE